MRRKIAPCFLCCVLLTTLTFQTSGTKRLTGHAEPVQAKTKLPRLDPSDGYLVYYGPWDDQNLIDQARKSFKLIIAAREITKIQVAQLHGCDKNGANCHDGALVFGYISIGEDGIKAEQNGPPNKGNGNGPCYRKGTTKTCTGKGKGVASYYLDQYIQVKDQPSVSGQDGLADRNSEDPASGSLYANTEDSDWRDLILKEADRLVNELKCDGLFLDTLDMGWRQEYEWTRPHMRSLIFELNKITPNILVNRGLFFVQESPTNPPAEIKTFKKNIWGLMFENFYTTQCGDKAFVSSDLDDNRTYVDRLNDVQVFALDYINCEQRNFTSLSRAQRDEVKKLGWHNYISWNLTKTVLYDFKCP